MHMVVTTAEDGSLIIQKGFSADMRKLGKEQRKAMKEKAKANDVDPKETRVIGVTMEYAEPESYDVIMLISATEVEDYRERSIMVGFRRKDGQKLKSKFELMDLAKNPVEARRFCYTTVSPFETLMFTEDPTDETLDRIMMKPSEFEVVNNGGILAVVSKETIKELEKKNKKE